MTIDVFAPTRRRGCASRHWTNPAVAAPAAATTTAAAPRKRSIAANVRTNDAGIGAPALIPDRGIANADTRTAASVTTENSRTASAFGSTKPSRVPTPIASAAAAAASAIRCNDRIQDDRKANGLPVEVPTEPLAL